MKISSILLLLLLIGLCSCNAKLRFPFGVSVSAEQQQQHQTIQNGNDDNSGGGVNAGTNLPGPDGGGGRGGGGSQQGPASETTTITTDRFFINRESAAATVSALSSNIPLPFKQAYNLLYDIVMYQPPVGIVSLWVVLRWYQKLLKRVNGNDESAASASSLTSASSIYGYGFKSENALLAKASRLDRHTGRALDLDTYDIQYQKYGGIERVRRRLLYKILQEEDQKGSSSKGSSSSSLPSWFPKFEDLLVGVVNTNNSIDDEYDSSLNQQLQQYYQNYIHALKQVLEAQFTPGGSHSDFVNQQLKSMAHCEDSYWNMLKILKYKQGNKQMSALSDYQSTNPRTTTAIMLLELATQTAQTRIIDSLLRLARDRLIRTTFRLSRSVRHWQKRVQLHKQSSSFIGSDILFPQWVHRLLGLEGDRMRLAFAEAAYSKEIIKLGRIVNLLLIRPYDMDDSALELAVQATTMELNNEEEEQHDNPTYESYRNTKGSKSYSSLSMKVRKFVRRVTPNLSSMAVRFNADGRGKLTFQFYDSLAIDGKGATQVLLMGGNCCKDFRDHHIHYDTNNVEWIEQSQGWNQQARVLLCDILQETIDNSVLPNPKIALQAQKELQTLRTVWCQQSEYKNSKQILDCWKSIFQMTRELHQYQRIGDGKNIKLKDVNFVHWFRQFDLLGIPSVILKIMVAHYVHNLVKPYFPRMTKFTEESYAVTKEIVVSRFYMPIKELLVELMGRDVSNSLMEGFSIQDEEQSLDNMLKDLNFGDGTADGRPEAIRKAMRQYEDSMNTGMIWNSNRLVRLILVQVQQLKCGMLHATHTVDLLLQANRFNFQLLTIIPAIVIVTVGTKLFVRALFTFRAKDIRPIRYVHSEMTEYIHNLESILLLAMNRHRSHRPTTKAGSIAPPRQTLLTDRELGEFVDTIYDYLVLLDSSSPEPFPSWQCDGIHQSITELLQSMTRLTLDEVSSLVQQVKRKHIELAKHF